jgi:subtilase-type serine protease
MPFTSINNHVHEASFYLPIPVPVKARSRRLLKVLRSGALLTGLFCSTSMPAYAVEPWIMVERTILNGIDISRIQGVTTDGKNWYFSGTESLEKADIDFNSLLLVKPAIPDSLKNPSDFSDIGLNHIGDIDYSDGHLYISLDSSKRAPDTNGKYERPVFAVFDAKTMTFTGQAFKLNPPNGTKDIASWVAVDAKNGLGYGMAYESGTEIAVYNLSDWSFVKYVPLSQPIIAAQGGKVFNGWMYFSTDNEGKLFYRANLETGEVEPLGNLKIDSDQEVQGLSFRQTADGWALYIINREETPTGMEGAFYRHIRPYGNALSGELHANIKGALIEDSLYARDAISRRLGTAFGGVSPTSTPTATFNGKEWQSEQDDANGFTIWGSPFGTTSKVKADGDAASFKHTNGGFLGGIDIPVENWRLGAMAGYSRTHYDVAERNSDGSSDNYQLGVYGGTQIGALGFRAGAVYGWHKIDTTRHVIFPAFSETLSTDYNANTAQVFGELAYRIDMGQSAIEPFANLAYVHLNSKAFNEKGGTTAALLADKTSSDNLFTTLGLRASTDLKLAETSIKLHGMLGWQHAYNDVTQSSDFTFNNGSSFTISGAPLAKNSLAVEAGINVAVTSNTTLGASYGGQFSSEAKGHAFKVNLDMKF